MKSYQWSMLQEGQLPLQPDGKADRTIDHMCSVTLIWTDGEKPCQSNSLIVDPCFSPSGFRLAKQVLTRMNIDFSDIGYYFTAHPHSDHCLRFPDDDEEFGWRDFHSNKSDLLHDILLENCPGHHRRLMALHFLSRNDRIWIVSDAILNLRWLKEWKYYWPNNYNKEEIVETWRSVAKILSRADWVVPGHGMAFRVSAELLTGLINTFQKAAFAEDCPEVKEILEQRLKKLKKE